MLWIYKRKTGKMTKMAPLKAVRKAAMLASMSRF